jgi:hypothetical protein
MLVVVGGQSRKIGKSSVVAALISALPWARWTAVKVSPHFHAPAPADTGYVLAEETEPGVGDSGRYLAAGAARALWLQVEEGRLGEAVPAIKTIVAGGANTVIESNSIVEWLQPDLYLLVVDGAVSEWKSSGRTQLARVDAFIVVQRRTGVISFAGRLPDKPRFVVEPPRYWSDELSTFVAGRLAISGR